MPPSTVMVAGKTTEAFFSRNSLGTAGFAPHEVVAQLRPGLQLEEQPESCSRRWMAEPVTRRAAQSSRQHRCFGFSWLPTTGTHSKKAA